MTTQTTTHTPGPWRRLFAPTQIVTDDKIIATLEELPDYAEKICNANLIAAAPELLKALKNLMKRVAKDAEIYALDGNEPIWSFIADASDAISKAEGKV